MKRFVRCQNCNRRLYGTDLLIVDKSNRVDELFCSHRCIKQNYGDYYCTIDCLKSKVFQESVNEL